MKLSIILFGMLILIANFKGIENLAPIKFPTAAPPAAAPTIPIYGLFYPYPFQPYLQYQQYQPYQVLYGWTPVYALNMYVRSCLNNQIIEVVSECQVKFSLIVLYLVFREICFLCILRRFK